MNKFLLVLISLCAIGCIHTRSVKQDLLGTYSVPLDSKWNLYVFDIDSDCALGRAFIADYGIWTAKHIFEPYKGAQDDVKFMGVTEVKGLTLCKHKPELNDMVYYRVNGKIKYLLIAHIEDTFLGVIPLNPIEHGDSGSPVISLKDGEVVGLVSALIPDAFGNCVGGEVARIQVAKFQDD